MLRRAILSFSHPESSSPVVSPKEAARFTYDLVIDGARAYNVVSRRNEDISLHPSKTEHPLKLHNHLQTNSKWVLSPKELNR